VQGKLEAIMTFGETPAAEHVPEEHHFLIHPYLSEGRRPDDHGLRHHTRPPDRPTQVMSGCSISLNVDSIDEAERVFNSLTKELYT